MAVLTPQAISLPALAPNYVAAAVGGDKVQINNGDRTFLHVKNGGGSSINVTLTTQSNQYRGDTIADRVVAVPATSDKMIPLDPAVQADLNGQVSVAYSGVTTVTVAALRR
jgi:hypothetical protein